jgi:glycosyltransferase involved in cell wall biosynthesis
MSVLCSISTRGRYDTTLPLAILSVINQTRKPDKLVIFDDNDVPQDIRELQHYRYLLQLLDCKGIEWEVRYGQRKGQHFNHQQANTMGYEWVWRLDDDTVAEPNTLEALMLHAGPRAGAVGGSVLTPPVPAEPIIATGLIEHVSDEPNLQWGPITEPKQVDHLHCSFIYRAGVHDYDLNLSRVAHREETMFTYGLKRKGYDVLVVPAVTWHLRNPQGGIRDGARELFEQDELRFQRDLLADKQVVVLDCGLGDHVVFKRVLAELQDPVVFSCYPEVIPGRSIGEARRLFGDLDRWSVYRWMDARRWTRSLEEAFREMYKEAP